MALSQVQIIQSLGEALSWFEKELAWGVSPAEMRHLTGRIGELYAAMITRGQMALSVNQRGYDVVSAEGERISVKTITSATHVSFNRSTFDLVDRVIVLRINVEEDTASIEELMDMTAAQALGVMSPYRDRLRFSPRGRVQRDVAHLRVLAEATFGSVRIVQLENGAIQVDESGAPVAPAIPVLRDIARRIGVDPLNAGGNPKNTRRLGADVLTALAVSGAGR